MPRAVILEETQALVETQPMTVEDESYGSFTFNLRPPARPARILSDTSLPPSNLAMELDSPMSSVPTSPISSFQALGSSSQPTCIPGPPPHDSEMLGRLFFARSLIPT